MKKKEHKKRKNALTETLESNRYEMLGKLSRKRVKRVFTPKIYVMHRKRRKSTQYDYRVQNPLYPFLCLSYRTQAPLQPKRPHKVCGICCCSEIRMYSNLRVWYCMLCCECKHPNHERCCEYVKKLAGNEVSDVEMW